MNLIKKEPVDADTLPVLKENVKEFRCRNQLKITKMKKENVVQQRVLLLLSG